MCVCMCNISLFRAYPIFAPAEPPAPPAPPPRAREGAFTNDNTTTTTTTTNHNNNFSNSNSDSDSSNNNTLGCGQNGVNTNGAAAKVMSFDRLGEKGTPWHLWEDKSRFMGVPKKSLCQKNEIRSDPMSADTICPFPTQARSIYLSISIYISLSLSLSLSLYIYINICSKFAMTPLVLTPSFPFRLRLTIIITIITFRVPLAEGLERVPDGVPGRILFGCLLYNILV